MTLLTQNRWTASTVQQLHKLAAARRQAVPPAMSCDAPSLFAAAIGEADSWQMALMQSSASRILVRASRQSGKSTALACVALSEMLQTPNRTVLIISPTQDQSAELLNRIQAVYNAIGRPYGAVSDSTLRLALPNGSRALALAGVERSLRGYSVHLLLCDESSLIPDSVYYAARPLLAATKGRLIAASTPRGRFGWWYEAFEGNTADEAWERYIVPASQVARLGAAFLENERKALPPAVYAAEYDVQWMDASSGVFPTHLIEQAFSQDVAPLW